MNEFKTAIISGLNEYLDSLHKALDGLNKIELNWQPSLESNNIIYLVWHMARVEDNWINQIIGGNKTVWSLNKWSEKLNIKENDYGKGYLKEDISNLPDMNINDVLKFYKQQRDQSIIIINELNDEDLNKDYKRLTGELKKGYWILGHVLVEESQHLGQIAYIRGMIKGLNK
tara:strand:- start:373 stop:888 length:516 start_codon:yes stop_codon:yes gene_type:complete